MALYPLPLVQAASPNLNVSVQSARLNRQLQISYLLNYIFLIYCFCSFGGRFCKRSYLSMKNTALACRITFYSQPITIITYQMRAIPTHFQPRRNSLIYTIVNLWKSVSYFCSRSQKLFLAGDQVFIRLSSPYRREAVTVY